MALRESHDIIKQPEYPAQIWPTAHDPYPVFRSPFYEVPVIPTKDEAFMKIIESKPEDRPETLHELMKEHIPELPLPKTWVRPEGLKRKTWTRKTLIRPKRISKYRVIPSYGAEEELSEEKPESSQGDTSGEELSRASLGERQEATDYVNPTVTIKSEVKPRKWLDGWYMPKTRLRHWPGLKVPKTSQRRPRSDFLQRMEKIRAEETYKHIIMMKEEHLKTADELEQEKEALRKGVEEEREKELARMRALKVDRSPIKGALKGIFNMSETGDLPIDIPELDKFCRRPQPDIEKLPAMMQQEEKANRAFVDYLDQNGISEMLIGTLFMIFSNPGPQENAKELLRLGLGGKPMETANVDDALQNIQDTKDRINELEKERYNLQVRLLKILKDNELPDEPKDPNNFEYSKRRMDYLLKAFQCRTRPADVPVPDVYDLPGELAKLIKYNISTKGYEHTRGKDSLLRDATTQLDYRPQ